MFEAVEFVETRTPGEPSETVLGAFAQELDAIEAARSARDRFAVAESDDYAWWIVRQEGARLATFIADSKSDKEFVLDLSTGELVEVSR